MQKTLGLIIKRQNLGETDKIVTFFSPTFGKKRAIARAVRKPTSKLAGHLDTFMVSQLMLTDAPDLPKITSAILVEPFEQVRESLPNLERAFAMMRIVERVILEEVNQQSIFQLTVDTLVRLNDERPWANTWIFFLGRLANFLGLLPSEYACQTCHQPITADAWWLPGERRFSCSNCGPVGLAVFLEANSIKLLQLIEKKSYAMIERITIPAAVAPQVEEVLLREITLWFNKPWTSYAHLRRTS